MTRQALAKTLRDACIEQHSHPDDRSQLRGNGFSEVLRGLEPGDNVVPASAGNLREASRVRAAAPPS